MPPEAPRGDLTETDTTHIDYQQQVTVELMSETHGGEDVVVWARGPSAHLLQGTIEQSYIFHVIHHAARMGIRASSITE